MIERNEIRYLIFLFRAISAGVSINRSLEGSKELQDAYESQLALMKTELEKYPIFEIRKKEKGKQK